MACQDIWSNVLERITMIMLSSWIGEYVGIWEATRRDYELDQSEGDLDLKRGDHVKMTVTGTKLKYYRAVKYTG
jgi:hypothetical protein